MGLVEAQLLAAIDQEIAEDGNPRALLAALVVLILAILLEATG